MLPNDKHVMIELERLAEKQHNIATKQLLADHNPTVRSDVTHRVAGWLGSRLTAWGTQLQTYSHRPSTHYS